MRSWARIVGLSALGLFHAVACGKSQSREDGDDCVTGSERCVCYRNGTCDGLLECRSGLCVKPDSGAGGTRSTGGASQGGKGGTQIGGIPSGGVFPTGGTGSTGGTIPTGGVFPTGGTGGTDDGGAGSNGGDTGEAGGPSTGGEAGTAGGVGGNGGRGGTAGGSGGAGGAGAGGTCGTPVGAPADTLIDNLEDGNGQIAPPRVGYWYVYSDMTCATTPSPDLTGEHLFEPTAETGQSGSYGARVTGGASSTWGAGIGFDLNNCNARQSAYDASAYRGISFWYKSTTPLRANVTTLDVVPIAQGGSCVDPAELCYNPHGVDLPASPAGTTVSILFASLYQNFGTLKPFDRTRVVNFQFQVGTQMGTWDLTIDNVSFVQ